MLKYSNVIILASLIGLMFKKVSSGSIYDKYVIFYLYTRESGSKYYLLDEESEGSVQNAPIDFGQPTILFINGAPFTHPDPTSQKFRYEYLNTGTPYNFIVVNIKPAFSMVGGFIPMWITSNLNMVTDIAADLLISLNKLKDVKLEHVHIIGTGVGGHLAGNIGQKVKNFSVGTIGRISAIDPYLISEMEVSKASYIVKKEDALFVDVINTYQNRDTNGHANFYPNGHRKQPECHTNEGEEIGDKVNDMFILDRCSHRKAIEYYMESISNPFGFPAKQCKSVSDAEYETCTQVTATTPFMGAGAIKEPGYATRIYYVKTNDFSPYAPWRPEYGIDHRTIFVQFTYAVNYEPLKN